MWRGGGRARGARSARVGAAACASPRRRRWGMREWRCWQRVPRSAGCSYGGCRRGAGGLVCRQVGGRRVHAVWGSACSACLCAIALAALCDSRRVVVLDCGCAEILPRVGLRYVSGSASPRALPDFFAFRDANVERGAGSARGDDRMTLTDAHDRRRQRANGIDTVLRALRL